jgi:hypothetical protein
VRKILNSSEVVGTQTDSVAADNQSPRCATFTLGSDDLVTNSPRRRHASYVPQERWTVDPDGWTINPSSQRLVWVHHDLRNSLLSPQNTMVIGKWGWLKLDFRKACVGESWHQGYQPMSSHSDAAM